MSEATDFLQIYRPGGPWILTAIPVSRKGIETTTFRDPAEVDQWIAAHDKDNLYFMVNPATRDLTKKAERTDVAELAWLHTDIDPRAGEDLGKERERALALLANPPGGIPRPTVVVFSGGGYQGFWKLADPVPIGGDLPKAEEAKLWNLHLEVLFGADACHNVDRIMRLPGTVNWPDERKQRKGRTPEKARVEFWTTGEDGRPATYVLAPPFQRAQPLRQADEGFAGGTVRISGNLKRLRDVGELDDHAKEGPVPDKLKVLIAQGNRPDDEDPYPSRSEALFAACLGMVRAGIPDEVIYSVITDRGFGISASVLDKGSGSERYALRQIERAKEESIHPVLRRLNDTFAIVRDLGNKTRVIWEKDNPMLGRKVLGVKTFEDFANAWKVPKVEVGKRFFPAGSWWLDHPMSRRYDRVVFAPGREIDGAYNLWRGFACEARPGDCSMYLDHVRDVVCSGDGKLYDYLIRWMAGAVQRPGEPGRIAVVLRGGQGTGKGIFARQFGSLFGRHFTQVSDPKHLVGSFNAHLRDCVVLFGDEAFWAGDRRNKSILKSLITEDTMMIEMKGVDAEAAPNCIHLVLASNEDWVVPAEIDDRRFFVLDVKETRKEDTKYFGELVRQMDSGGRGALLHHLLSVNLTGFDVWARPETEALDAQKEQSLEPHQDLWLGFLRDGFPETWSAAGFVWEEFMDRLLKVSRRQYSCTTIGMFLGKRGLDLPRRRTGSRNLYVVEQLDRERERWTKRFPRMRTAWDQSPAEVGKEPF